MAQHPHNPETQHYPPSPDEAPKGDATGGVIPYKNGKALAGYYCAVFSLIPVLGFLLGPAGFILGILGWKTYKREPHRLGHVHAWIGILLGGFSGAVHYGLLALAIAASISSA